MSSDRRDTVALEPSLITDPVALAEAESRNGLLQIDLAMRIANEGIERGSFKLRPSMLMQLQRVALQGLSVYAGSFRPGTVKIEKSGHVPPPAFLVPELVEQLCDYVNDRWLTATAMHLAAYVMWRLNWIHPFADGNGRTSRAASFLVFSVSAGFVPPGKETIPSLIVQNRTPYFDALEAADASWEDGERLDVSVMEELWQALLARQLTSYFESAGGRLPE